MDALPDRTDLLLTNGRVIDPATGRDGVADVAVAGGRVVAIGPALDRSPASRVIDAGGMLVTPGLIDPHVHLRDPGQTHKGDIGTETRAAAAGGFTAVCCMPNTDPPLDTPELVRFVQERARGHAKCRVFVAAAATKGRKGEQLAEIGLCSRAGAVAFTDDGDCIADAGVMLAVLRACGAAGRVFLQHAQDPTLTRGAAMHAGTVSARLGLGGWPRVAEEVVVERDCRLVRESGARYHCQHISSGGTVDILRRAREAGLPVSGEASPHHLLLTHEACDGYETSAKMNPPLRESGDVEALRQAVAEGVITVLATDHAPHTAEEKARPFEAAPFGIIGLETAVALYAEALVHSGAIGWPKLVELLTLAPARLLGLDARGLGRLSVGGPADLTLIDPDRAWTIEESELAGKSRNTPFLGRRVRGRPVLTLLDGRVAYDGGR